MHSQVDLCPARRSSGVYCSDAHRRHCNTDRSGRVQLAQPRGYGAQDRRAHIERAYKLEQEMAVVRLDVDALLRWAGMGAGDCGLHPRVAGGGALAPNVCAFGLLHNE